MSSSHEPDELNDAIKAISSMIARSEKAQVKFASGTSQYTLQKNRIHALYIALSLVKQELTETDSADNCTKENLEKARAPIASLISKSEKARQKLSLGTWQHTMLSDNLNALHIALRLIDKGIKLPVSATKNNQL